MMIRLRIGSRNGLQRTGVDHTVAHHADEHGDCHGDYNPGGGNAAGGLELFNILNGHEPQENVGHTKIAEAPCQGGENGDGGISVSCAGSGVIGLR